MTGMISRIIDCLIATALVVSAAAFLMALMRLL
jgi:hypothetical protein